ncbi:DUF1868 domain-containing protein [Litoreibacter sp.]|nr:DUF1868 domain-containing protein [Litoreibacter sp.]
MSINTEIAKFLDSNNTSPPPGLGQRYDTKKFLPESGNTVVCHLDLDTPTHGAVLKARRRMQALPGADRFLYTPKNSLHMTVFEGVIETRRTPNTWPAEFDSTASVESATNSILARLTEFSPPPSFAVRVEGLRPTGLILKGATAEDDTNMRVWREALTEPFGYRHDDHDSYKFHMTFAYPVEWLPESAKSHWESEFQSILADLVGAAPIIPLRPPAFCQFADMNRFEELLILNA